MIYIGKYEVMNVANYTKKAIMKNFEDMLREMPFEKITVSQIVARCEISPNTFYYHYKDIYDLLGAWLDEKRTELLQEKDLPDEWACYLKTVLHAMKDNSSIVYHVFDSISRERLERYIFCSVEQLFCEFVKKRASGMNVSDDTICEIGGFCCYSFLGFLLKFIWNHMNVDIDSTIDRLSKIFDGTIEHALANAQ